MKGYTSSRAKEIDFVDLGDSEIISLFEDIYEKGKALNIKELTEKLQSSRIKAKLEDLVDSLIKLEIEKSEENKIPITRTFHSYRFGNVLEPYAEIDLSFSKNIFLEIPFILGYLNHEIKSKKESITYILNSDYKQFGQSVDTFSPLLKVITDNSSLFYILNNIAYSRDFVYNTLSKLKPYKKQFRKMKPDDYFGLGIKVGVIEDDKVYYGETELSKRGIFKRMNRLKSHLSYSS